MTPARRPRVAHLTSAHPATDVRIFHKECRSLARAGFAVTLVAPDGPPGEADGVVVVSVPRSRGRVRRMTVTTWRVLRRALQLRADLYHFHDSELISVGLALRALGKRVVYDIHEDTPRDLLTRTYLNPVVRGRVARLVEVIEAFAAPRFSALVAATPTIAERFRPLNPRTVVVNNYPIRDELVPPTGTTWRGREPAIAYVGSISTERGIMEMVRAMVCLPGTVLELAGAFSDADERARALQEPGWSRVRERGLQSREQVAALLGRVQAGLVLFHPAPNNVRAQPNKLFEYMSAGVPVIASDFPLWREVVEGEGCGLLVDPFNAVEVAEAVAHILGHPEEAEAMGRRGRAAVEQRFNWAREEATLVRLYRDVLGC